MKLTDLYDLVKYQIDVKAEASQFLNHRAFYFETFHLGLIQNVPNELI